MRYFFSLKKDALKIFLCEFAEIYFILVGYWIVFHNSNIL